MQTFANLSEGDCTQSESGHDSLETKVEGVACSTSASYLQLDAKCKKNLMQSQGHHPFFIVIMGLQC